MQDQSKYLPVNTSVPEEESIDLKEIWRIIRVNRWFIFISFMVVLIGTTYWTFTSQPVYESKSTMLIKKGQTSAGAMVFDLGGMSANQQINNELEILKSYTLHEEVIRDFIRSGQAGQMNLFGTKYVQRRYRFWSYLIDLFLQDEKPTKTPEELNQNDIIKIASGLRGSMTVSSMRETDIITVSVSSSDSAEAIILTNAVSEKYKEWDLSGARGEMSVVLNFLKDQVGRYEIRLEQSEDSLKRYQERQQIFSLDGSADLLLQELSKYEGIYYTNMAEMQVAQERVDYLKSQLNDNEKQLLEDITNTNNPMIIALRQRIAEMEAQKVQNMVEKGWAADSPQVRDFDRRISEMKDKLRNTTENLILSGWSDQDPFAASQDLFNKILAQEIEVYAARSRVAEYKKLVDQYNVQLNQLPIRTLNYARLERERRLNENLFLTMKQKFEESRVTEAGQIGKVRVLDPAIVAEKVKPNKKLNLLLGAFLGLGLGIGIAFIREYLDNTIKSVEELEKLGLSFLGLIPEIRSEIQGENNLSNQQTTGGQRFRSRLITHFDPKSPISESYRSIRTNLNYSSADKPIKSLVVTSAGPGEGKSTTIANIAIAFAQLGKKTLLIDTDLRRPVLHNVFQVQRKPGITDYLIGDIQDITKIIQPSGIENLFIMTAGNLPPNPSELLGSKRMAELVDQLEHEYDMTLLDSPPIVAVTDAAMVSKEIDALMLVVKAGETDKGSLERALDALCQVRAPVVGVVLNGATPSTMYGSYYYYYQYYYYTQDGERKKGNRKGKRHRSKKSIPNG